MLHIILAAIVSGVVGYGVKAALAQAHLTNVTADFQSAHDFLFNELVKAKKELVAIKASLQVKL